MVRKAAAVVSLSASTRSRSRSVRLATWGNRIRVGGGGDGGGGLHTFLCKRTDCHLGAVCISKDKCTAAHTAVPLSPCQDCWRCSRQRRGPVSSCPESPLHCLSSESQHRLKAPPPCNPIAPLRPRRPATQGLSTVRLYSAPKTPLRVRTSPPLPPRRPPACLTSGALPVCACTLPRPHLLHHRRVRHPARQRPHVRQLLPQPRLSLIQLRHVRLARQGLLEQLAGHLQGGQSRSKREGSGRERVRCRDVCWVW